MSPVLCDAVKTGPWWIIATCIAGVTFGMAWHGMTLDELPEMRVER